MSWPLESESEVNKAIVSGTVIAVSRLTAFISPSKCLEDNVVADPADGTTAEQMVIDWALYMSNDPSGFMSDIGNTLMCPQIPADECVSAITAFESNYGIELTEQEDELLQGLSSCGGDGFDDDAIDALFANMLNSLSPPDEGTDLDDIYFDFYGFKGLLQFRDGVWFYERSESWFEQGENVHYYYIDGSWKKYDLPDLPADIHFLDAVIGVFLDSGHLALDLFGFVPAAGEIADGVNAVWYFAEGDISNGTISAAAMVPLWGTAGTGSRTAANTLNASPGIFQSAKGLRYTGNRLKHVYLHLKPNPNKTYHGVFSDPSTVINVIDEAFNETLLTNSINVIGKTLQNNGNTKITVELNRVIGYEGGIVNNGQSLTKIQIILKGTTNDVISAYPAQAH